MSNQSKRLAQNDVMAAINAAVEVETKRIEQITEAEAANVAGGFPYKIIDLPGTTMGLYPAPEDDFLF